VPERSARGGALLEDSMACQAVLHMNGRYGITATHRAGGDMVGHSAPKPAVELTVDECVEVPAVAEMVHAHHGGENPLDERLLPAE
jgi:hypothetical protein